MTTTNYSHLHKQRMSIVVDSVWSVNLNNRFKQVNFNVNFTLYRPTHTMIHCLQSLYINSFTYTIYNSFSFGNQLFISKKYFSKSGERERKKVERAELAKSSPVYAFQCNGSELKIGRKKKRFLLETSFMCRIVYFFLHDCPITYKCLYGNNSVYKFTQIGVHCILCMLRV